MKKGSSPSLLTTGSELYVEPPIGPRTESALIWRRFGRNTSISLLGSMATALLTLIQTALLVKSLKVEEYGLLLIVTNFFAFLEIFVGINVRDVIFRFFQEFREQKNTLALRGLLLISLGICLTAGLVVSSGVFISAQWIARRVYQNSSLVPLLRIYAGTVLISA